MAHPDRPNRTIPTNLDAKRPGFFDALITTAWPRQSQPTKAQSPRLWKRFITSSYLVCCIPYWKLALRCKGQQPIKEPPALPSQISDLPASISTFLSTSEQRLLGGLEQVASDIKVWRAFRSKAMRFHLASNGGLGDNLAAHGWIPSTGK